MAELRKIGLLRPSKRGSAANHLNHEELAAVALCFCGDVDAAASAAKLLNDTGQTLHARLAAMIGRDARDIQLGASRKSMYRAWTLTLEQQGSDIRAQLRSSAEEWLEHFGVDTAEQADPRISRVAVGPAGLLRLLAEMVATTTHTKKTPAGAGHLDARLVSITHENEEPARPGSRAGSLPREGRRPGVRTDALDSIQPTIPQSERQHFVGQALGDPLRNNAKRTKPNAWVKRASARGKSK